MIKKPENSHLLRITRESFKDFLYTLMVGLVFLVPHQATFGLAIALFVYGASCGIGLLRQSYRVQRAEAGEVSTIQAVREVALPGVASLGLLVISIAVMLGEMVAIYGLVIVVAALLAT